MIALGFYMLEQQGIISFSQLLQSATSGITLPAWMVSLWNQAQVTVTSMFDKLTALSTADPRYAYIFATVVFGTASLFLLYYLFDRITRRIFP